MEIVMKRKVDKETNAETWTLSMQSHTMKALCNYISHEIDVSKGLDADINFPTIHQMSHWVSQSSWYRALQ